MVSAEAASNFSLIGCSFPQVNQTLYAMDKISGLSHGSWIHPLEEWPSKKKSGMKKQFTGHLPIDRGTWVTTIAKITRFWTKVYCHKKPICKIFNLSLSSFTLTLVFDRNNWVMTDLNQVIYILLHSVSMLLSCCSTLLPPLCKFVGCQSVYAYFRKKNLYMHIVTMHQSPVVWYDWHGYTCFPDSHIHYMTILLFNTQVMMIWKMEQQRKKVTQKTLFQACVQCTGVVDLKVGNEEEKMTQSSTLFLAYANLSWYINCSLTCYLLPPSLQISCSILFFLSWCHPALEVSIGEDRCQCYSE
jgi:hypothetical protein